MLCLKPGCKPLPQNLCPGTVPCLVDCTNTAFVVVLSCCRALQNMMCFFHSASDADDDEGGWMRGGGVRGEDG